MSTDTPLPERGLYVITPESAAGDAALIDQVRQALAGGAVMVQYRAKKRASIEEARRLRQLCADSNVHLIINDDPELALAAGAAGVHLGRDDTSVARARQILGPQAIIGVSCYNRIDRLRAAAATEADYAAMGCFFTSTTKPDALPATPELLRQARAESALPVVAIGGVTPENGGTLIAAGAHWLAASSGVFESKDIAGTVRRYQALFRQSSPKGGA
ncbi:MAG TPA: thiamine phosphate synthase [Gammaproteobacteria bacterium]|nr:thiamine phosphate synthase [Gammaproteobacteria bacterium]